jgi:hypothetical protein
MRRLALFSVMAVLVLGLAPSALADAPTRVRSLASGEQDYAAGEACDFAYHQEWVSKENFFLFGDPDAPDRMFYQAEQQVTHTNALTGYTLTETAAFVDIFYPGTAVEKLTGVFWHLRDADGRLVAVHAGQMVIDWSGDNPLEVKVTPKMDADFWGVICTALGGNPA